MEENNKFNTTESAFEMSRQEKKLKRQRRIIRLLMALLAALLLMLALHRCGYFKYPWEKPSVIISGDLLPGSGLGINGHLPNMTEDEIRDQMQEIADSGRFAFKINSEPVFADGRSEGTLLIENPNYNVYPMVVRIFAGDKEDMNQLLFDSGGLLPDQHIYTARLTKVLPEGNHKATAYFYVYDPQTTVYLGKQSAGLNIVIKN